MKNIIITGGELFNKGAQAMTYITVDEMKKRFPDHQIYVLSELDNMRPETEKKKYAFQFLGWYPVKIAEAQKNGMTRLLLKMRHGRELSEAENIYRNTDLMVDISGYALGTNWGTGVMKCYAEHMKFAESFQIPMYLMPQSFGPFVFETEEERKLDQTIAELLPKMKLICAREQKSYDELTGHYKLKNVISAEDIVLNNKEITLSNVFTENYTLSVPEVDPDSVALVPNVRTADGNGDTDISRIYAYCVSACLKKGYHVYIVPHADDDMELCRSLKNRFSDHPQVHLLEQQFDCVELDELIKRFRFVIASRYHAVVHAYKNQKPCIVLGWAQKYEALLKKFRQEKYWFDIHRPIAEDEMEKTISLMDSRIDIETEMIGDALRICQERNVFDEVDIRLKERG